jgi:hypothetical protein
MTAGDRVGGSTRGRGRAHLPVPLERVPTVYPPRKPARPMATRGSIGLFLKRLWQCLRRGYAGESRVVAHFCKESHSPAVNPATGLPMVGHVDTAGNPFGSGFRRLFGGDRDHVKSGMSSHSVLQDLPPFRSEWDEPRITMESIDRRWDANPW